MNKTDFRHSSQQSRAIQELEAYRQAEAIPARARAVRKWPERAIAAGVAAKLARHFGYFILRAIGSAGSVSW